MIENSLTASTKEQLREGCKASHARWAAWLEPLGGSWEVHSHTGLSKARLQWLQSFVQEKMVIIWLAGALSSQRRRSRDLGNLENLAGCKHLYLFPASGKRQLLLVGADKMDGYFDEFWRVIALRPPECASDQQNHETDVSQPTHRAEDPLAKDSFGSRSAERSLQLKIIQENAIELISLAQTINVEFRENSTSVLAGSIQDLLQHFLHRVRSLFDAPYAQLGWIEIKQIYEPIPQALGKEPQVHFQSFITDEDPDLLRAFPLQDEIIFPIHSYIATIGENVLSNDLTKWSSVFDQRTSNEIGEVISESGQETAPLRCHSIIGVPLHYDGRISGSLVVLDNQTEKSFSEQDLNLLELLMPQLEIAIGYARLNSLLEERITAQNLAESRLVRSARLAAVGEMAAGVAHELNNPLTTVTGFVELALNEIPQDSPLHDDLDLVLKEALRARGIVRGLLDFSRPSQDQRIPADLNDLISQVLNLVRHMLRMNNLSIRLELWDDLPLVMADPNKIQQVLHNLMQNAIRAMPDGGTLTIRTSPNQKPSTVIGKDDHGWVSFLIQDTGVGIPTEDLGRIFEPFYTHQHSDRIDEPGIGLGLSISYGIIQNHGGVIEVASEVNQGSKFTVFLPLGK